MTGAPAPLGLEQETQLLDSLDRDINTLYGNVATCSAQISNSFQQLAEVSNQHLTKSVEATSELAALMAQAANFSEYEVNTAVTTAREVLFNIEEMNKSMMDARRLQHDLRGATAAVGDLEILIAQMEMAEKQHPNKK